MQSAINTKSVVQFICVRVYSPAVYTFMVCLLVSYSVLCVQAFHAPQQILANNRISSFPVVLERSKTPNTRSIQYCDCSAPLFPASQQLRGADGSCRAQLVASTSRGVSVQPSKACRNTCGAPASALVIRRAASVAARISSASGKVGEHCGGALSTFAVALKACPHAIDSDVTSSALSCPDTSCAPNCHSKLADGMP